MKSSGKEEEEWAYVGEWSVEEPTVYKGMENDKGLVVKNKAAHHAISAKFPKKVDNKGKTLVVQYEVKLQSKCFWRPGLRGLQGGRGWFRARAHPFR